MDVLFYVDGSVSNFGDDLNRWLWRRLLGSSMDSERGTLLLGIGTILSKGFVPPGKQYVVMGSGVGYDVPPQDFGGPSWKILAVRGPLTAATLGLPPEKAVIDGAALLRLLPELKPLLPSERAGVAFMPHYELMPAGNWKRVCEMAGIEFLNPLADSQETVQRIRRAGLVIADAMHAAIVADALRVPWIPVVISPQTNTFKWLDWTMSLDLPYNPARIPASTLLEAVRNWSLRFCGNRLCFAQRTPASAIERYNSFRRRASGRYWPILRRLLSVFTHAIPRRVVSSRALAGFRKRQDKHKATQAAERLRQIATMPGSLSDEQVFQARLDRLAGLLEGLKAELGSAQGE